MGWASGRVVVDAGVVGLVRFRLARMRMARLFLPEWRN